MMTIKELHHKAMALAEQAVIHRQNGELEKAEKLFRESFKNESEAAFRVSNEPSSEPTRSVLFRSAAALALDCGESREAERLAAAGLAGYPPPEIADELREILEKVNFQRYCESRKQSIKDSGEETITGRLKFADAVGRRQIIKIVDENRKRKYDLTVPTGMMDDIVKPLWNELVTAVICYDGKDIRLKDIKGAEDI